MCWFFVSFQPHLIQVSKWLVSWKLYMFLTFIGQHCTRSVWLTLKCVWVKWWYQWNGKFHRVIKPTRKAWVLQSLSVRGKKVEIEYYCGRIFILFCIFFQGQSRRAFLSPNEFISNKLAAKITRQLQGNVLFAVRMKSLKYIPVFEVADMYSFFDSDQIPLQW